MVLLPLVWTLLTVSLWTSGSGQILQQLPVHVLYPSIHSTEVLDCDCTDIICDSVYWFRSISNHRKVQFIGRSNKADRTNHGDGMDKNKFIMTRKGSSSFSLRITDVTEEDAGIYSCVLKGGTTELWKPGVLLRPGVIPPTLPPPPKKKKAPVKPLCRCKKKQGCGSLVFWPLVGLIAALALGLICALYYFSRLPKKCQHRFVKR